MRVAQVMVRETGWSAKKTERHFKRYQEAIRRFCVRLPVIHPARSKEVMSA